MTPLESVEHEIERARNDERVARECAARAYGISATSPDRAPAFRTLGGIWDARAECHHEAAARLHRVRADIMRAQILPPTSPRSPAT